MKYINKTGLERLVQNTKALLTDTIQKEYNHVVTGSEKIVTAKNGVSLTEYTVQCLLNGRAMSIVSLAEISTKEYSDTRKGVWHKSAGQTGVYANILTAISTAGRGVLKLTIENTKENSTESHYICFIEDTPSRGAFLFATTCEWDIEVRQETNVIHAYLKIPDNFAGTITIQGVRCNLKSGSLWTIMQPRANGVPIAVFNMLADPNQYFYTDGNTYEMEFFTAPYGSPLSSGSFITPFGKYKTDVIFDFGTLNLNDKIQDSIINDALIHDLNKRISTLQESKSAAAAVNIQNSIELMIYDKGLYVIAPNGYIDPNDTDVEFARYVKTSARYYESTVTPKRKFHRKKKGWVTPRYCSPTGTDYQPVVNFILEEQTVEFKYISKTGRQIFEVVFPEDNYLGDYIAEAFENPIMLNSKSYMSLTNKKLGIRLVSNDTGLPITDWLPFSVRYIKHQNPDGTITKSCGLSRWV